MAWLCKTRHVFRKCKHSGFTLHNTYIHAYIFVNCITFTIHIKYWEVYKPLFSMYVTCVKTMVTTSKITKKCQKMLFLTQNLTPATSNFFPKFCLKLKITYLVAELSGSQKNSKAWFFQILRRVLLSKFYLK